MKKTSKVYVDQEVRLVVDGDAFTIQQIGYGDERQVQLTRVQAEELLSRWEPHMKNRGGFLVGLGTMFFRSYDVKSTVRLLRKALAKTG